MPGRTLVMGVLNVTPDSFSDAGLYAGTEAAVRQGLSLVADGADLVDVGGESTRPGAGRVEPDEELRRVLPVVQALADAGVVVSIDTMRSQVAHACVGAGAQLVNDVSGGLSDPRMLGVVADLGVRYVAMHWRGPSADMQTRAGYDDVVAEVLAHLSARREAALAAGIAQDRIVLDPGLGFGKQPEHNWQLLAALSRLRDELAAPLLLGASRKAFLGALLAGQDSAQGPSTPRPPVGRDAATAAVTVLAAQAGAWAVRVHEVRASADAVRVVARVGAA